MNPFSEPFCDHGHRKPSMFGSSLDGHVAFCEILSLSNSGQESSRLDSPQLVDSSEVFQ